MNSSLHKPGDFDARYRARRKEIRLPPEYLFVVCSPRIGKDISRQNRQIENEEHKPEQPRRKHLKNSAEDREARPHPPEQADIDTNMHAQVVRGRTKPRQPEQGDEIDASQRRPPARSIRRHSKARAPATIQTPVMHARMVTPGVSSPHAWIG